MKKILLAVTALSIALAFSSDCYAQGTTENPGPRNNNTNSGNGSGRYIPIGDGTYVYDRETGATIMNPDLFPPSSSSGGDASGECDPLTSGWEACLRATRGTVMIGGDQGSKMEKAYNDTQRNSSSGGSSSSSGGSSSSSGGLDTEVNTD